MINYINDNFNLNGKETSNFIDAKQLSRHRWYYYKEGFSPNLASVARVVVWVEARPDSGFGYGLSRAETHHLGAGTVDDGFRRG